MTGPQATPNAALRQLIEGYRVSQMIFVAAELGIADLLADGPRHCVEIASATRTDAPTLFRLMRALASAGVFARVDGDLFTLTPLSDCLRTGVAGSLRPWAVLNGRRLYPTWAHLDHSIATGDTAFDHLHGISVWEYLERDPEEGRVFHDAMAANITHVAGSVVNSYDFSRFGTLVDVGGGKGALIQAVLTANPELLGILFDVPAAIREAAASFALAGAVSAAFATAGADGGRAPNEGLVVARVGSLEITAAEIERRMATVPGFQLRSLGTTPVLVRRRFIEEVVAPGVPGAQ